MRKKISPKISCQVCQKMFHLAGKRPISRQVEQKMRHLTGERLLSGVMTEVRGDGGEKGERVSRAFFCPRKL
ncbi:MAG: hypothetical protein II465_01745, partial [Bacteroidales bacterium]|nr:hypothetical protein [Bacteroidales bacterium]